MPRPHVPRTAAVPEASLVGLVASVRLPSSAELPGELEPNRRAAGSLTLAGRTLARSGAASPRLALLLTAISSAAVSLALPPFDRTTLAWCGGSPLLFVLARQPVLRAAILSGLFATGVALLTSSWLPQILRDALGASGPGAIGLWLLLGALAFPLAALFGGAVSRIGAGSWLYVPAVALGWTLVELGYARVFPGLPWLTIGATAIDSPIAPLASVLGVHAVSGLVLGANAVLAQALLPRASARALCGCAALALITGVGLWAAPEQAGMSSDAPTLRVAFVQPGLPMSARTDPMFAIRNLAQLIEQSPVESAPDLIVWPESAFVSTVEDRPLIRSRVMRFVRETSIPVLAGGYRHTDGGLRISAYLFEPGATPRPVHDKQRLVPLAEAVPGWASLTIRRALGRLVPSIPIKPGDGTEPPASPPFGLAVLLCHEAAFSGALATPEAPLLANLVNDGWYDRAAGAAQQLQLARWRAIESGAPLVRVAATGVSALIDATGAVTQRIDLGRSGARTVDVRRASVITPFERLGYGPVVGTALLAVLLTAGTRFRSTLRQETP